MLYSKKRNSDTSAPLPPRPLVTSAPSHLGPTTISAPVWKKSLVRSAPSYLGPIFIVTSAQSYNSIILIQRKKKERKKKEIYCFEERTCFIIAYIHFIKERKKKKERKKERNKQTNKMACAPREDSDQPGHPPSLIRVFAVRMKKAWVFTYPLSAHRRFWSDWADAQADLSLRWAQRSFCWFSHEAAHIL